MTPSIILKKIKSLNSSKACGYDNIPISFIKDAAEEIAPIVSHMINRCIEQSVFPTAEMIVKVTPIYKGDSHKRLEYYRPISVLNSKIHEQLYEFLETNGMLGQSQFGFRKNRSTQHAVTLLTDQIRQGMDQGKFTGAVFVDLSKAFDTVDNGFILSKA